jgi:lysophospholipase L1-like esterase
MPVHFGRYCFAALSALVLVAGLILVTRGSWRQSVDASGRSPYQRETAQYLRRLDGHLAPHRILFIGDSRLLSVDVSALAPRAVNLSIGGETAHQLLQRIADYRALPQSDAVVIATGINDLPQHAPREIAQSIMAIVKSLPPGVDVVLAAVLPVTTKVTSKSNEAIRELNRELSDFCRTFERCHFVAVSPELLDATGALAKACAEEDGIHLSPIGNQIWSNDIRRALQDLKPAN